MFKRNTTTSNYTPLAEDQDLPFLPPHEKERHQVEEEEEEEKEKVDGSTSLSTSSSSSRLLKSKSTSSPAKDPSFATSPKSTSTTPSSRKQQRQGASPSLVQYLIVTFLLLSHSLSPPTASATTYSSLEIQQPTPTSSDMSNEVSVFAQEYQALRNIKGHFAGGPEFIKDVDGFEGKKHKAMQALGQILGKPGTHISQLVTALGLPDEVVPKPSATMASSGGVPLPTMPGPVLGPAATSAANVDMDAGNLYLIYYWRGRHDYLWFLVNDKQVVEGSDWYQALE
ncbi:hypothetical protein HDU76_005338 [Blyttiomyces sp. JEL0837]|nr:hypothetical protein HDU76_005338 [Blyttiomyces sp. JEL0837]